MKLNLITVLICLLSLLSFSNKNKKESNPNFIIILVDDQGWNGTSVQMMDNEINSKSDFYQTPNIEKLAKKGIRFSSAYASAPVCAPSRYSIQFGQTPARLKMIRVGMNTSHINHLTDLIEAGVPIVFFDRICHEIETAKITTNDFASGFNATEHLIHNGCKKIAYLSISENLSIDNKRKQGYFEALSKHDFKIDESLIVRCSNDEKENVLIIKSLLTGPNKPDAIFASIEKLALLTYAVCNDIGIKIPQNLKVISFSNLRTASLLNPSLTTITQPAFEMGEIAAKILFKYLAKRRSIITNENIVLKSELTIRNSTNNKY